MGEWILGASINILGSISINLGTNLLKLGHNQREREALQGKSAKSVAQFQAWQAGLVVFILGNCLNFVSFGYAAQSLLAALGSVQFISNIAFAYFVLDEVVTRRIIFATAFIVFANAFLVAFGNHQSPIFTPEVLLSYYKSRVYIFYCTGLLLTVIALQVAYRKGREYVLEDTTGSKSYWKVLLPLCYAVVSGAVGTHSVLFAKSLSIFLRLTLNGESHLDGWFTYVLFILFLVTAAFWMTRLNDGLAMFDAILIVPMLQICWTTFSMLTGFVYFQEYKVFDGFRACMFAVGMLSLFFGISLLAPEGTSTAGNGNAASVVEGTGEKQASTEAGRIKSLIREFAGDAARLVGKAKSATLGFGQGQIHGSAILSMPMLSSSRSPWRNGLPTHFRDWHDDDEEQQLVF